MNPKFRGLLRSAVGMLHMFGGPIGFYVALWLFGLKPAIGVAIVFVVFGGGGRLIAHKPIPGIWRGASGERPYAEHGRRVFALCQKLGLFRAWVTPMPTPVTAG